MKKKSKRKPRDITQLELLKKAHPDVYAVWRSEKPKAQYVMKEDLARVRSDLHKQNWPEDYRD